MRPKDPPSGAKRAEVNLGVGGSDGTPIVGSDKGE